MAAEKASTGAKKAQNICRSRQFNTQNLSRK
jgi:hypothetical protein